MKENIKSYTKYKPSDSSDPNQDSTDIEEEPVQNTAMFYTNIWLYFIFILPFLLLHYTDYQYDLNNLKLSEVGDYLAGVAAPVAFFWLVMGYFQQSKQLRLNNKLLQLQHRELETSVTAQQEQASSMKQQLNLVIRDKYYPKFNLISFEKLDDQIELTLHNSSNQVYGMDAQVLSDNMAVIDISEIDHTDTRITMQVIEEYMEETNFEITLIINFTLETTEQISKCYKLKFREFLFSPGNLPNFSIINCKD